MRLENKSALITGAARGIGRAFAEAYVREGATVAIADIDLERAEQSARAIGDKAYAVRMDVTDQASIEQAIRTVEEKASIARALEEKVWPLLAAGTVRPLIDRVFPLSEAAEAHRWMEKGEHVGKIVLTMEG